MKNRTPLVSSDLLDHRERPPNIKHDSKSPLISSDLPDHRQKPPNIKHDSESPLISIDFRAPKIKKTMSK